MNQITSQIFLGDAVDAQDIRALTENKIRRLLNCAEDCQPALKWADGFKVVHIGLADCTDRNDRDILRGAVLVLRGLVSGNHNVLVHCMGGVSRSAIITALYLREYEGFQTLDAAISFIQTKRPCVKVHAKLIEGWFK